MIEILFIWISNLISAIGYFGVFILMIMESMVFPVPSEAVMPFAGYLASTGRFNFILILIAATIGTLIGSLISYYIGLKGEHLIRKYHKLFLLNEHDLDYTNKFFIKNGSKTIFIARFIPVIRHLISIPAGMGKMNLKKFIAYTLLGGLMWNFILVYLGYKLGENWKLISNYSKIIDIFMVILIIIVIVYFVYAKQFKKSASGKLKYPQ
jgi:membrane protein DedA with SNARE-associated domain